MMRRPAVDVVATAALLAVLGLFASLQRPPEGAAETAAPSRPQRWTALVEAAREVRENLLAQPDVRAAEVRLFTPEQRPLLVVVSLAWATPEPPVPRRLETIARWARERMGTACEVHVLDATRRCVLATECTIEVRHE